MRSVMEKTVLMHIKRRPCEAAEERLIRHSNQ